MPESYKDIKIVDNSPSLKRGDSPTYTLRGFRVWSSCFPVATNVSTPQADTECPSANMKHSSLRYKKQEKFAPYIPIAKARGFTALSGKWHRFELTEHLDSDIPEGLEFAGNYVAFFNRKCLYVGQSNNLKKRLKSHIRLFMFSSNWQTSWGTYTRIVIAIRKEKFRFERMTIEARLIHRLNPIFNGLSAGQVISKRKELYLEPRKGVN